ncbi:MAG: hypothetical protein P4M11_13710 [Candidatus Pacebacteria bacterium]|nr:hypothetical protein [Candidatus Paceibacterota bacterium]
MATLFSFTFIILLIIYWNSQSILRQVLANSHVFRVMGAVLVILESILIQPMTAALLQVFSCQTGGSYEVKSLQYACNDVTQIVLMVAVGFIGSLLLVIHVLSVILYNDDQPLPALPWENCCVVLKICKFIRKLAVSFVVQIAYDQQEVCIVVAVLVLLLDLLCIYQLFTQIRMRDKKVFYALAGVESIIIWVTIAIVFSLCTGDDVSNPVVLVFLALGLFFAIILWCRNSSLSMLLTCNFSALREVRDVETYCRILLDAIEDGKERLGFAIKGIISVHTLWCQDSLCPCRELLQGHDSGKEETEKAPEEKMMVDDSPKKGEKTGKIGRDKEQASAAPWMGFGGVERVGDSNGNQDKERVALLRLIIVELSRWNKMQEGKARLHIYLGYLKLDCTENQLSSLFEEMCGEEMTSSLYEKYHAYRLKYCCANANLRRQRIEEQMTRRDSREQTTNEMNNLVTFQRILAESQENMQDTLKLFIGFWKELQNESPNFQYLGNTSHQITENATSIRMQYKNLITVNTTNMYCRMLYALFLKKIMKDEFEAFDVFEE